MAPGSSSRICPVKPGAELVTTGAELLNGRTANRHAQTLGDRLGGMGIPLLRDTTVPDDLAAIEDAVRGAWSRSDLVFVSGGLGPTSDDVTREAVAGLFGAKLVTDEAALRNIHARYARIGKKLNASVERHALVLDVATVLPNSAGLAPGERIERDGKVLFLLPGPPREFLAILTEHILPWLEQHASGIRALRRHVFQVCGLGESDIVSLLEPKGFPGAGVDVAYCAQPGRVEIRFAADSGNESALDRAVGRVRTHLAAHVYAEDRSDLETVVGRLMRERKATLATAESCTGGLVGHRITAVDGSSAYYLGGVVAYANESKIRDLGVPEERLARHGAVSASVAEAMAAGVRARFGADYGLAITGIAGPTGGTPDKPVGLTFIAVADAERCVAREHRFNGDRALVREWGAQMALDLLRRVLAGLL